MNKLNEIKSFFYGLMLYLQIDKEVAIILISLILIDMFAGSIKAVIVPELKFSFGTFWAGFIKKAFLLIIVMVLALMARGLGYDDFKILPLYVMKIMIVIEGASIINCGRSIMAKKDYKSSDFMTILIDKIESFIMRYLEKLLKFFDNNSNCL